MADSDTIVSAWSSSHEDNQEQHQLRQQQQQNQQPASEEIQPRVPRRVCAACRRRKVGCDKKQPCQHCKKSGSECIYPPDNQRQDERQILQDTGLLERLHRLEPMLKTLASCMEQGALRPSVTNSSLLPQTQPGHHQNALRNGRASPTPPTPPRSVGSGCTNNINQPEHHLAGTEQPATMHTRNPSGQQPSTSREADLARNLKSNPGSARGDGGSSQGFSPRETSGLVESPYGTSTGKLVRDDGRQRYVSGTFWESLHTEHDVDEAMVSDYDDESEYDEDPPPTTIESSSLQYALIFNSCAQQTAPDSPHPPYPQRLKAWDLFKANVHPVATILHIPSVEPLVLQAFEDPLHLPPPIEALLFVVYFGAINSLSSDDCELHFGSQQSELLSRFRRGADSGLARSRLMDTDEMLTLQTFVLYLVVLRSRDPTYSWNATGLAVRLAQSLGVHRDGSSLGLMPFDAEMRRRLWWGICILDTPASEDHSCSPGLMELSSSDSRPPLNVNDADLHPGMTEYPGESTGITDMSFTAVRCWASSIWRMMIDTRRVDPDTGRTFESMTVAEKQAWVDDQREKIVGRFSGDKTSREPLHCLVSAFIGTIISNLRLMALKPLGQETSLDEDERTRVFKGAIECMTHSYRMRTDPLLAHWSWLTKCYHEWHAFAIILSELSSRPLVRDADKAWRVVEQSAVLRWDSSTKHRRVHQWRSVMRSIDKARRRRKKELGRRRPAPSVASSAVTPSRTGTHVQQQLWPPVSGPQGDHCDMGAPYSGLNHDAQMPLYGADEMMGALLEDEMCNFAGDDGQVYFV